MAVEEADDRAPTITRWLAAHADELALAPGFSIAIEQLAGGGFANEVLHLIVAGDGSADADADARHLVLRRSPSGPTLFPPHDLDLEVAAQAAAHDHGVAVPTPVLHEPDPAVLGTPFLVMPLIEGRNVGMLSAFDEWVMGLDLGGQTAITDAFLAALSGIHTAPWRGTPVEALAIASGGTTLDAELDRWDELVAWAFDGAAPPVVTDAFAWCRDHRPATEPEPSLLWGDVRYGNTIIADDGAVLAVLDWEMTAVGPAEHDLAWFTALEEMSAHFAGVRVPGFPTRDEIVERHAAALGRPLDSFAWYEAFALCRSMVLNQRRGYLHARATGKPPRPAEDDAVVQHVWDVLRATELG